MEHNWKIKILKMQNNRKRKFTLHFGNIHTLAMKPLVAFITANHKPGSKKLMHSK